MKMIAKKHTFAIATLRLATIVPIGQTNTPSTLACLSRAIDRRPLSEDHLVNQTPIRFDNPRAFGAQSTCNGRVTSL